MAKVMDADVLYKVFFFDTFLDVSYRLLAYWLFSAYKEEVFREFTWQSSEPFYVLVKDCAQCFWNRDFSIGLLVFRFGYLIIADWFFGQGFRDVKIWSIGILVVVLYEQRGCLADAETGKETDVQNDICVPKGKIVC